MGGFFPGALAIKGFKKRLFIYASKILGIHKNIYWHTSTEMEKQDIKRVYHGSNVFIAKDLPNKKDI